MNQRDRTIRKSPPLAREYWSAGRRVAWRALVRGHCICRRTQSNIDKLNFSCLPINLAAACRLAHLSAAVLTAQLAAVRFSTESRFLVPRAACRLKSFFARAHAAAAADANGKTLEAFCALLGQLQRLQLLRWLTHSSRARLADLASFGAARGRTYAISTSFAHLDGEGRRIPMAAGTRLRPLPTRAELRLVNCDRRAGGTTTNRRSSRRGCNSSAESQPPLRPGRAHTHRQHSALSGGQRNARRPMRHRSIAPLTAWPSFAPQPPPPPPSIHLSIRRRRRPHSSGRPSVFA